MSQRPAGMVLIVITLCLLAGCAAGSGSSVRTQAQAVAPSTSATPGTSTQAQAVAPSTSATPGTSTQAEKPKAPKKPLLLQGEKTLQLSDLTPVATDDSVRVSFKVKASARPKETVSIVIFSPSEKTTTSLDVLEVLVEGVVGGNLSVQGTRDTRLSFNLGEFKLDDIIRITENTYGKGEAISMSSTYRLRQGVLLCFDASPGQLEAGKIEFNIKRADWEKPLQIGLAEKSPTEKNVPLVQANVYTLISNVLNKAYSN